jgi:hypothetical protein
MPLGREYTGRLVEECFHRGGSANCDGPSQAVPAASACSSNAENSSLPSLGLARRAVYEHLLRADPAYGSSSRFQAIHSRSLWREVAPRIGFGRFPSIIAAMIAETLPRPAMPSRHCRAEGFILRRLTANYGDRMISTILVFGRVR